MRTLTVVLTIFLFLGCAKSHMIQQTFTPQQIIHIENLKKIEDVEQVDNSVFYLEKGDIIPLKVSLDSQWIMLKQTQVELIIQQKVYFRILLPKNMTNEKLEKLKSLDADAIEQLSEAEKKELFNGMMLHISRDAENWAPISHPDTLKDALGIEGGTISFGAGFSEEEGFWTNLVLKVIQKP
ncbi:MAG: hypothetical protein PVI90_07240 [Desulfobacteraceae bacterium]|jgi:hypothetical protein